jgi:hypothetical protein
MESLVVIKLVAIRQLEILELVIKKLGVLEVVKFQ